MNIVLSIIVCTFNRQDLLPLCLRSLAEQTLDKSLYEVIVVNNNSTDGTQEIAKSFAAQYGNFRVVVERKQGLSHARNCGWREALGEFVAYIDDDAKATREWCERILNAFQTVSPQPAAVGGKSHPFYETPPPPWFTDEFEIRTWGTTAGFLELPRARYGFSGSNMAFRKNILEVHSGFSAEYGMTGQTTRMGEETELFYRVYDKQPYFWYDPAILVYHWTPARIMKVSYRFWRAFSAGEAITRMQKKRFSFRAIIAGIAGIAGILLSIVRMLFSLIKPNDSLKMRIVIKIEELGYSLGFFFGAS